MTDHRHCLRCGVGRNEVTLFRDCVVYGKSYGNHLWSPIATHRCKVCGALWKYWKAKESGFNGDSWSLVSETCGECCDNTVMGDQIEPVTPE